MSDTDSFIEEVTEEVRRDRLFGLIRRYGWIGVLLVLAVVGGAAWNEWQKASQRAEAQRVGDAMYAAIEAENEVARSEALRAIEDPSPEAKMIADFLAASHDVMRGESGAAAETYAEIAQSEADMPEIYRQIATFKSVTAGAQTMPVEERRIILESMAAPGAPLSLLAQEQLALIDIEQGQTEAAIGRLQQIIADAGVSAGLRRRATQLIVALGGQPDRQQQPASDQ